MARLLNFTNTLSVDLEKIMVPINKCICVTVGTLQPETISQLEKNNFDQAPVLLSENCVLGGISTKRLRQLLDSGQELLQTDNDIRLDKIYSPCSLVELLDLLKECSFRFVCVEYDGEQYGTANMIKGLITISDLNKHYIRSLLYIILSELEILLASIIKSFYPDSWKWFDKMNACTKDRILKYWEFVEKRNVEVGLIEACTISDLLNVIRKDNTLLKELSYVAGRKFDNVVSDIRTLRNTIMHPVRPLVTGQDDIIAIKKTVENIIELTANLENLKDKS